MHLWLALSPHGYGHAVMTAPLVAELRRRRSLSLTIQTSLPGDFLRTRYGDFHHVETIPDIGFHMVSPTQVDVAASLAHYRALHGRLDEVIEAEAARLAAAKPDMVLANIPYVTVAAAARVGVPVVAFSSLNWADMALHYFSGEERGAAIAAQMHSCYAKARIFLRTSPGQPMTVPNQRLIGPVAVAGIDRRAQIRGTLDLAPDTRIGLIAYGGIEHRLPLARWQRLDNWFWLVSQSDIPNRPDMASWREAGISFHDLAASVDVLVGKTGYGTFTEAGLSGTPILYEARPDWPEAEELEKWLGHHTRCLPAAPETLLDGSLPALLQKLFSLPIQAPATADGIKEGCDSIESVMGDI